MKRIEFKLSMPNRGSWNGGWSGSERNYTKVKKLTDKYCQKLGFDKSDEQSWYYNFGDGWCASVCGKVLQDGVRPKKSDGFCGYDWMVDEIISYNEIKGKC